ncbi:MAG: hypothetical protein A2X64_02795 [Ignavibacteria bacterium GWF2_33_9]|nr:MAG: hypothetical protein A2X64_02795 [Ignavibacteria bacterium GWF2_33_9]
MKIYRLTLLIVLFLFSLVNLRSQDFIDTRGTDFWLTFLPNFHNLEDFPIDNFTDSLYIFIVGYEKCSGTIEYKDYIGQSFSQNFQIDDPTIIYKFALPYLRYELRGYNRSGNVQFGDNRQCETIAKNSFHITSTSDITVYAHEQAVTTSESMTCLPTDALGMDYFVITYNSDGQVFGQFDEGSSTPSQFAIVATENQTNVTIIPSSPTRANGMTVQNITLNKGDVYLVQSLITRSNLNNDLTGTRVTSDKPIALEVGHQRATLPYDGSGASRDCLLEQIPPITAWGRNAIVTPFAQNNTITTFFDNDLFRIIASSDDTEIFVDGISAGIFKAGEIIELPLDEPHYIEANAPILACQYKKTAKSASSNNTTERSDPLMMIMPPIEQYGNFYRFTNMQSWELSPGTNNKFEVYTEHYINVACHDSIAGMVEIDGNKINPSSFQKIPGTQFSYAILQVQEGTHEMRAPTGFGINVYGYGYANSYGYYGGMNLIKYDYLPPKIGEIKTCYEINGYITDSTEVDTKIVACDLPIEKMENVDVTITDLNFPALVQYFNAKLINKYLDGKFTIKATDSTGLFSTKNYEIPGFTIGIDSLKEAQSVVLIHDTIAANAQFCWDFNLVNYGKFTHTLEEIYLEFADSTEMLNSIIPMTIDPGKTKTLQICKTFADTGYYEFILHIQDSCGERQLVRFEIFALLDKLAPRLETAHDTCNTKFYFNILEPLKSDAGIESIELLEEENGTIEIIQYATRLSSLQFIVYDSRKDAYFKFSVKDSSGNETIYEKEIPGFTLDFAGNSLDSMTHTINYGEKMIGARATDTLELTNYGKFEIVLENPFLLHNLLFSIPQSQFPMTIKPNETKPVVIVYKPISVKKQRDRDTLVITMNCLDQVFPIEGKALQFNITSGSKCDVPLRFTADSIPTSMEASLKSEVTEGIVNLVLDTPESAQIQCDLYDQSGRLSRNVFNGEILPGKTEKAVNLNDLTNGVYYIMIRTSVGSATLKVVKIK